MIVEKEILSKIPQDYVFLMNQFKIDASYFKKRIDEGVKTSSISYKTNVYGKHTDWRFFNDDPKFIEIIMQVIDHVESLPFPLKRFMLEDAWGIIENFGEYTKRHSHEPSYFSGVLYLNDHSQKLYFPDLDHTVTPKAGRLLFFSSFLNHYTKRNTEHKPKYAIAFNFRYSTILEKN